MGVGLYKRIHDARRTAAKTQKDGGLDAVAVATIASPERIEAIQPPAVPAKAPEPPKHEERRPRR